MGTGNTGRNFELLTNSQTNFVQIMVSSPAKEVQVPPSFFFCIGVMTAPREMAVVLVEMPVA